MKIGAHFLPEDFPVFMESVETAEQAGYDRAWVVDSQMLWEDVWVYLTRALAATERIQFGVAVANPLTRHYTVTASTAATLAQLHPGRVLLGLGRGDSAVRTLGLKQVATSKFAEVVPQIRVADGRRGCRDGRGDDPPALGERREGADRGRRHRAAQPPPGGRTR